MRLVAIGIAAAALLALITPPAGAAARAARGSCVDRNYDAFRLGPMSWTADLDSYKNWDGVSRIGDDGTYYAKMGMRLKKGATVSLAIAPRFRRIADINYGHRPADVKRLRSCDESPSFFSGGFVVTEPVCLEFAVRVRGSRRVYRETASIGKGDAC
jgi:hypothetical protein